MADIQSISYTHDQIMNWLVANPEKTLKQCAEYFQYTQAWLSTVIHSDAFKSKFKERQDAVFGAVMEDIPIKLKGLADAVVEQLGEQLEKNTDKDFTLDAFDKIMHRAGYAPASGRNPNGGVVNMQNNFYAAPAEALAEARARMLPKPFVALEQPQPTEPQSEPPTDQPTESQDGGL